jgi:phage shock protein A
MGVPLSTPEEATLEKLLKKFEEASKKIEQLERRVRVIELEKMRAKRQRQLETSLGVDPKKRKK